MVKRVVAVLALLSCVAAVVPQADAHYIVVSGRLLYHSLGCELNLQGVPNTAVNEAFTECAAFISQVETLCENPKSKSVAPGQAATQVLIVTQEPVSPEDLDGKGKATVEMTITDDDIVAGLGDLCVNKNWNLIRVLVRTVTVTLNTYQCTDGFCSAPSAVLASTVTLSCSLPAQYDIENLPDPDTEYECTTVSSAHLK